jgi:serine/threonine protein kinase
MNEVQTIRDRKHDYIVKLFASFSAGRENPWGPDCRVECLHMLFEHTKSGNMHTWLWLEEDEYTEKERHDHIKETIQTIVEAVTCIHESRNGDIAFHHDLKPSNILRFEGPPAVWKICDFGMAKLKNVNDGSATVHRTDNHFGTYDYQPPEYFDDAKDPRHGRPFDMWSLGCIMLELLTVWKHGRKKSGIREFRRRRGENTVIESPKRWQGRDLTSSKEDYSFHNNRITIQEWMEHLRDGTAEGDDFCRLLDLVEEMLVDRYQRIFIWELHMDLFEMTYPRPTQEKLIKEYRRVVQPSGHPIDDASNHHNPLKRALKRRKTWQESILVREKWSVCKPKPSTELNVEVRGSTRFYSTLQECTLMDTYEQGTLFGRQDMDDRITGAFRVSSIVGLFGIAGIGYASLFHNQPSLTTQLGNHTTRIIMCRAFKILIRQNIRDTSSGSKLLHPTGSWKPFIKSLHKSLYPCHHRKMRQKGYGIG